MPDTIQDWVNNTIEDSQAQWAFLEAQKLDDTFGWGAMTGMLHARMGWTGCSPKEGSRKSCGLLLTGPEGCGKHTTATYMMQHLQADGYEPIFLNGIALGGDAGRIIQQMEALLEHFMEQEQGVCILLEEMEESPCRRELLTYFGQQLRNYWIADFPPLFLILIDSREQQVPSCLRSQLMLCRMSLPTRSQRSALLKKYAAGLRNVLSMDCFAEATAGATYAQLMDMITAVYWLVDSQDLGTLSDAALREFLAGQMPAPAPEDAMQTLAVAARQVTQNLPQLLKNVGMALPGAVAMPASAPVQQTSAASDDAVHKLVVTAQQVIEQLPQLLKDMRVAVPATVAATPLQQSVQNNATQNPADYMAKRKKEIDEMPVRDLATELFGEEGVQEMLSAAQMQA